MFGGATVLLMSSVWGNVPSWISAGVALASAVVAAVSAVKSRKARAEADQRAKDAAEAAVRSAEAQQQAADAAARSAESQSQAAMAVQQFANAYQEQARIRSAERASLPVWHLERRDEFNVLLHNVSSGPLFHVTADGEQVTTSGGFGWDRIDRGSPQAIRVLAGDDAGPEIDVAYYETEVRTGTPRRWRGTPR